MKAMDIIERVDLLEPNDYSPEQKLHWLATLDGKIYREVIKTHADAFIAWPGEYVTGEEQLIVGEPFGEDIYYYYLQAMIAAENSETQRYNKRMTMFNSAYQEWTNWYNRNHMPVRAGSHFVF
ncbi:MAG: hypothetical protein IJV41_01280 [Oscillospiraceae bacterium]|nr:hypothetical protein [Oscillospiraceae bacterium]